MTKWVLRLAALLVLVVLMAWAHGELEQRRLLVEELERWQLPSDLPTIARHLDELRITGDVDRIDWLPEGLQALYIERSAVRSLDLPIGVQELHAAGARLELLNGLPADLRWLDLRGNPLTGDIRLPRGLRGLVVGVDQLEKLRPLPASLTELEIHESEIEIEILGLPERLEALRLEGVEARSLAGLPEGLQELELDRTAVAWIRPWPLGLRSLLLRNNRNLALAEAEPLPRLLTRLTSVGGKGGIACTDLPKGLSSLHLDPPCQGSLGDLPQLRSLTGVAPEAPGLPAATGLRHLEVAARGRELEPERLAALEGLPLDTLHVVDLEAPDLSSLPSGPRRIVLTGCELDRLGELPQGVRSLEINLCTLGDSTSVPDPESWAGLEELVYPWYPWVTIPDAWRTLETLDLTGSNVRELPASMPELRQLRIAGTCIAELPEMSRLEVLDVSGTGIDDAGQIPGTVRELTIHLGQLDRLGVDLTNLKVLHVVRPPDPPYSRCVAG